jgi:hypothetical protein
MRLHRRHNAALGGGIDCSQHFVSSLSAMDPGYNNRSMPAVAAGVGGQGASDGIEILRGGVLPHRNRAIYMGFSAIASGVVMGAASSRLTSIVAALTPASLSVNLDSALGASWSAGFGADSARLVTPILPLSAASNAFVSRLFAMGLGLQSSEYARRRLERYGGGWLQSGQYPSRRGAHRNCAVSNRFSGHKYTWLTPPTASWLAK